MLPSEYYLNIIYSELRESNIMLRKSNIMLDFTNVMLEILVVMSIYKYCHAHYYNKVNNITVTYAKNVEKRRYDMNIVKVLNKQIEAGKTVVLPNGDMVKSEDIDKSLMKDYLAGVKSGAISPEVSFKEYAAEKTATQLTVQEVINFVTNPGATATDAE